MRGRIVLLLLLGISISATALEDGQTMCAGGTAPLISRGIVGRLDTTSATVLVFDCSAGRLEIPYAAIHSFDYSRQVKHHLGVLPAIAVALVKQRQHQHLFRISLRDENNLPQIAILEVSKHASQSLEAILKTRAPEACKAYTPCSSGR